MLVIEMKREVLLALESQNLLGTSLGASREDIAGDAPWTGVGGCRRGEVRDLNVMDADIRHLDGFSLELSGQAGTVKSGAKNDGLVRVNIGSELVLANGGLESGLHHRGSGNTASEDDGSNIVLESRNLAIASL